MDPATWKPVRLFVSAKPTARQRQSGDYLPPLGGRWGGNPPSPAKPRPTWTYGCCDARTCWTCCCALKEPQRTGTAVMTAGEGVGRLVGGRGGGRCYSRPFQYGKGREKGRVGVRRAVGVFSTSASYLPKANKTLITFSARGCVEPAGV